MTVDALMKTGIKINNILINEDNVGNTQLILLKFGGTQS